MIDVFHRDFDMAAVASATGAKPVTINSWIAKGHLTGLGPRARLVGGGGPGRRRSFGFHTVMEIAIAKAILDQGLTDLGIAFFAAQDFAHMGEEVEGHLRHPGLPYRDDVATLICLAGRQTQIVPWTPGKDFFARVRVDLGRPEWMGILDADRVFQRVVHGLGADPIEVIRAGYEGT